jgi:type IV fimbrial biogenesis protein FimT
LHTTAAHSRGLSLVECLVVVAIGAIVVGSSAPGFGRIADRHRLEGAAAQLETTFQYARGLAVTRQQPVRIGFQQSSQFSCYVVHTGGARDCDCMAPVTTCKAGAEALATTRFDAESRLRAKSNSASMLFDADRGTVTPTGTVELQNRQGDVVHVVINIMGRVRTCSTTGMSGFGRC